jgi:phosphotransferase system enzyme I (PtsI)
LTVQLDREAIAAIATDAGTGISHVAILARSLGLPAVVGLRDATQRIRAGDRLILDGAAGVIAINPTDVGVAQYHERQRQLAELEAQDALMVGEEPVTTDGVRLLLRANVDLPEDAVLAAHSGADGVGLMRTEFMVVGRATMPDEDEQYRAYRRVVEAFKGQAVIIRTYDIGGDKLPVGGYPAEPNPFLGWRAIRMCLDQPQLFRTQLRAILRAAQHGDVRVMLPLVITLDEVLRARELLEESARELAAKGVPHRASIQLGVMVETPAAAVAADTLAPHVDFFSIGTNDLTQYTLAIDRGNANLASRFTPLHPAVLRLIHRIAEVGTEHGIDVGVCGEMASQPLMAYALVGLGVRQLSVAPRTVARMKRVVRGISARAATESGERRTRGIHLAREFARRAARRIRAPGRLARPGGQHYHPELNRLNTPHWARRCNIARRKDIRARTTPFYLRIGDGGSSRQDRRPDLRRHPRRNSRKRPQGPGRVRDHGHDRARVRGG